jgi:hypothetical protein
MPIKFNLKISANVSLSRKKKSVSENGVISESRNKSDKFTIYGEINNNKNINIYPIIKNDSLRYFFT